MLEVSLTKIKPTNAKGSMKWRWQESNTASHASGKVMFDQARVLFDKELNEEVLASTNLFDV